MRFRWAFISIPIFSSVSDIGSDATSISQTILQDMIPQQFEGGGQSQCSDPGTTSFRYQNEINFSESYSRWDSANAPYEVDTFLVEMSDLSSNSEDQKWTARFGQGGNIYSLYGAYGEAIPPQGNDFSPFVDEVIQTVAHDTSTFNGADTDYYIHQAGAYLYRNAKLPERPAGVPPPFYSPTLGMECSENTCRFMTWGQQAHLPTTHRSDVLYFHQYRNCGSGVIEYTQVMQYVGDPSDNSGTQTQFYLNTPWTGIRTSNLPDLMFSATDGVLQGKIYPMPQFGTASVIEAGTTGGFTTLSQKGKDVSPPLTSLAIPCVETSGTWNYACSEGSQQIIFRANSNCVAQTKPDKRMYIKCAWPQNPHTGFTGLQSPIAGCQTCGKEMQIRNSLTGNIVKVRHILDWNRAGYISFESSECTATNCPISHAGMVNKINTEFSNNAEVIFSYSEDITSIFEEAPSLTFVHGQGWSRTPSQKLQYGQGGAAHRRDMTVFTLDSVANLFPGESFVSRQYMINDVGANVESKAQSLKNAVYSTIVTNAFRNDPTKTYYGGRKISIYASGTGSFDVAVASVLGGQTTSCGSASATSQCEGVTVPKDGNGNIYQLRPFYFITCGSDTYFGPDQYHFTPPIADSNNYYQANLCSNTGETTTRPVWEFLGFFSPTDPGCLSLQNSVYDKTLCDQVESTSPSYMPSSVPSNSPSLYPSTEPSSSPSFEPSTNPSEHPSVVPSSSPTKSGSTSPSIALSSNPSTSPSVTPSSTPSNSGSHSPSKSLSSNPSTSPSVTPSSTPSNSGSHSPSKSLSSNPSTSPSVTPSSTPSIESSSYPTHSPTSSFSLAPSQKTILNCKSWCSKIPIPWYDIAGKTQKCDFTELCDGCPECEIEESDFYWIVCGKLGSCPAQQKKAHVDETHEVRCCSDTAKPGWSKKGICDVWGGSLLPTCKDNETYASATQICEDNNARLCTKVELELGCTSGSGCSHDKDNVWSSTPWEEEQSHFIVCGKGKNCNGMDFSVAGDNEQHEVTCCSDEEKPGWNQKSGCNVWAKSKISGSCHSLTYDAADHLCSKNGARLCTKQEILDKCAKNSGCGHNKELIWSETIA